MKAVSNIAVQADGMEEIRVRTDFSENEISQFNSEHMRNAIKVGKIKDEIKDLNKDIKEINKTNKTLVDKVILGFSDEDIKAYYIDDQFEGVRNYYNEYGEIVQTRKLRPEEKSQLKLAMNQ